jgi:hypothetical protein
MSGLWQGVCWPDRWSLTKRYKDHCLAFKNSNPALRFVQHLSEYGHTFDKTEYIMHILHFNETGTPMNTIGKFCMYKKTIKDIQLHNTHILQPNKIFKPILQDEDHMM